MSPPSRPRSRRRRGSVTKCKMQSLAETPVYGG